MNTCALTLLNCFIASVLPSEVTAIPYSGLAPAAAKNAAFESVVPPTKTTLLDNPYLEATVGL